MQNTVANVILTSRDTIQNHMEFGNVTGSKLKTFKAPQRRIRSRTVQRTENCALSQHFDGRYIDEHSGFDRQLTRQASRHTRGAMPMQGAYLMYSHMRSF